MIYSNIKLKKEITYLKYDYTELKDRVSKQQSKIDTITSKVDETSKFVDDEKEVKEIESDPYYNAIENLDNTIFLKDFENYKPNNNDIKITKKKAKKIAQKGFEESKNRIAGEGTEDIDSETIQL